MIVPVILAGGVGTRLWPLSRREFPKQFARLLENEQSNEQSTSSRTLFQDTLLRVNTLRDVTEPVIVCGYAHQDLVLQQLAELNINDAHLIIEPIGRSTAPAVAVVAMLTLRLYPDYPDATLLVMPSDHAIADTNNLHQAVYQAERYALENFLVCFGVKPTRPETGYGYIKIADSTGSGGEDSGKDNKVVNGSKGCETSPHNGNYGHGFGVERFIEKPNQELAVSYLQSPNYYWNSGMFMLQAQCYLNELEIFANDIFVACQKVVVNATYNYDNEKNIIYLGEKEFADCRSDSVDYAVMEHTKRAVVIPLDAGWSDVGSWLSLWENATSKDAAGNVLIGDVIVEKSADSYVHATSRKVVALGVENCIIIETKDAVLIVPKDRCQEVKSVVEKLL